MKVTFIGVGEAFDELLPNNSQHLVAETGEGRVRGLIDCGFNVPFAYWRTLPDPEKLDFVYLTHFHGDHCFGLPALLLKLRDVGRTKTLHIVGRHGVEAKARLLMQESYSSLFSTLDYTLEYHVLTPDKPLSLMGCALTCAKSGHPEENYALRVLAGGKSLFSSGDGHPTEETEKLAQGCDLAVQEAYAMESATEGHGTVQSGIEFGRRAGVKRLALAHVRADVRRSRKDDILKACADASDVRAFLPEPGDVLEM
jgi:ribonuclease BN (tRNA processing enzyme)